MPGERIGRITSERRPGQVQAPTGWPRGQHPRVGVRARRHARADPQPDVRGERLVFAGTWSAMPPDVERLPDHVFDALVDAEIEGRAGDDDVAALFSEARRWREALLDRLDEADDAVKRAERIEGPERAQVVADFEAIA